MARVLLVEKDLVVAIQSLFLLIGVTLQNFTSTGDMY